MPHRISQIQINAAGGQVEFFFHLSEESKREIQQLLPGFLGPLTSLARMLGDAKLHAICDDQLHMFLGCNWDGTWKSLPDGMYLIDHEMEIPSSGSLRQSPIESPRKRLTIPNVIHAWQLFSFLLSQKIRERVFEPAFEDALQQYVRSRLPEFQSKWQQRWITACFVVKSILLVFDSCRVASIAATLGALLWLVPPAIKERIIELWHNIGR